MSNKATYTNIGWLWFCPVYMSDLGDGMNIDTRRWVPGWLMSCAECCEAARIWLTSMLVSDYEPSFMFRCTGTLDPPVVIKYTETARRFLTP